MIKTAANKSASSGVVTEAVSMHGAFGKSLTDREVIKHTASKTQQLACSRCSSVQAACQDPTAPMPRACPAVACVNKCYLVRPDTYTYT
jgi:hypothetical protein